MPGRDPAAGVHPALLFASHTRYNPLKYTDPSGHWPAWVSYAMGVVTQILDDNTLGIFYAVFGGADDINDAALQDGRDLGRAITATQSMIEITVGIAMIEAAAASIPPTTGGGLACALASGGVCAAPAGVAVAGEAVVGIEGMILTGHGGAMLARAGNGSAQTGGHTISDSMLKKLGLTRDEAKAAIEALKEDLGLPNDFHGKIMENGDYINPRTGKPLGNLKDYLP